MRQVQLVGATRLGDLSSSKVEREPGVFALIAAARKRGQQIGGCWSELRLGTGNGGQASSPVTLEDLVDAKA